MGSFSIWHWLIVLVVVLLVFGRGKIPELMGDMAKGIKSFKKGMPTTTRPKTPRLSSTGPTRRSTRARKRLPRADRPDRDDQPAFEPEPEHKPCLRSAGPRCW
jgi:sec-independent protein translocase protein TatA